MLFSDEELLAFTKNPWLLNDKVRQFCVTVDKRREELAELVRRKDQMIDLHNSLFVAKGMKIPSVKVDREDNG